MEESLFTVLPGNIFKGWLARAIEAQLVALLTSLPFLCSWGLPLSLLTLPANLLLAPVVTLFLLASSLAFAGALVGLPIGAVSVVIEWCCGIMLYMLSFGSKHWLLALARPPLPLLFVIPASMLWVLRYRRATRMRNLALLFGGSVLVLWAFPRIHQPEPIFDKAVHMAPGVVLHARNVLHKRNIDGYVRYGVLPSMVQNFGTLHITRLVVQKAGKKAVELVEALQQMCIIDTVAYRLPEGSTKYQQTLFRQLREVCLAHGTTLVRT